MHITIEKKILVKSLWKIHSIVERRNSIPILANVKLKAVGSSVFFSVTDMDLYAVDEVPATVTESGSVTLPMHTLFEVIKKLSETALIEIAFSKQHPGEGAVVTSGKMECSLPVLPAEEFPSFTETEHSNKFTLEAKKLKNLLTTTKYAISTEETRYYLNGVFLYSFTKEDSKTFLKAVATDSHRLAASEIELEASNSNVSGIIIPRKTVNELIKLLEDTDSAIELSISNNRIMVIIDSLKLSSKLIDGKFPDYNKAIPTQNNKQFEVGAKALFEAIDLVTTISFDKTKAVKFSISATKIVLSVHNSVNGASRALQEVEASYNSEPIEIAFNGKYVLDVLSVISGAVVSFSVSSSNAAVLIRGSSDASSIHIIMPMQV
ncbi:MAG: DNA polymerase III subunit beta [Candidatus Midichloria sp.]|nr:MAG: DNA polymerase III subunit beta [Candidatus Midichloria sp.]